MADIDIACSGVADMVHAVADYGLWLMSFVADMVCGRYRRFP